MYKSSLGNISQRSDIEAIKSDEVFFFRLLLPALASSTERTNNF